MNIQFGRWNFDGQAPDGNYLERARALLQPYGPDEEAFASDGIAIFSHAFHTTPEAHEETQPHVLSSGAVMNWDGRLDNRVAVAEELQNQALARLSDLSIVAAAYQRWGVDCFPKLIGDWSLVIWDPCTRSLVLAKDFLGSRHLYYSIARDHIAWSTILDPLVLLADRPLGFEEEYLAGWLSALPAVHLTPYIGIQAVPPACFVTLTADKHSIRKYWDFDGSKIIRYRTDAEYEEHFRLVFADAVRRRLRSASPILAHLSGGMDSSSIVCMADHLMNSGSVEAQPLDTVSYYDDREPHWNERPYFTKVEEQRGRKGLHIDAGCFANTASCRDRLAFVPQSLQPTAQSPLQDWIRLHGHRVVLSGMGGDEVTGGVPTPIPELQDLLVGAEFRSLIRQLGLWSLQQRRPWLYLAWEALQGFLPDRWMASRGNEHLAPWFRPDFVQRNRWAFHGYEQRLHWFGALPSFQENLRALEGLRRQLASSLLGCEPLTEKRYPYLDRTLLEFLYAIPREQLVRPGQRRSLMRRALVGLVPAEILGRRRKAYVSRSPMAAIRARSEELKANSAEMILSSLGFLDTTVFQRALEDAEHGRTVHTTALLRTLSIEEWLTHLSRTGRIEHRAGSYLALRSDLVSPLSPVLAGGTHD
jgi:asparagine synthase (glutamine-hydrolysing)